MPRVALMIPLALAQVVAPALSQTPIQTPVQTQVAPERELAFSGFNAFPLKGSVKAGGVHPCFAVMVAGGRPALPLAERRVAAL